MSRASRKRHAVICDPNVVSAAEVQAMVAEAQSDFVHHPITTRLNSAKTVEPEFGNPA
jgi:hypothetical protein